MMYGESGGSSTVLICVSIFRSSCFPFGSSSSWSDSSSASSSSYSTSKLYNATGDAVGSFLFVSVAIPLGTFFGPVAVAPVIATWSDVDEQDDRRAVGTVLSDWSCLKYSGLVGLGPRADISRSTTSTASTSFSSSSSSISSSTSSTSGSAKDSCDPFVEEGTKMEEAASKGSSTLLPQSESRPSDLANGLWLLVLPDRLDRVDVGESLPPPSATWPAKVGEREVWRNFGTNLPKNFVDRFLFNFDEVEEIWVLCDLMLLVSELSWVDDGARAASLKLLLRTPILCKNEPFVVMAIGMVVLMVVEELEWPGSSLVVVVVEKEGWATEEDSSSWSATSFIGSCSVDRSAGDSCTVCVTATFGESGVTEFVCPLVSSLELLVGTSCDVSSASGSSVPDLAMSAVA